MADEYSLKWNKHQKTVVNCLSSLRQTCSFVDVTLHTADGHTFSGHKVVLSACSSFFENVFRMHPTEKVAVFLKDISHTDLRYIMEFVYSGEISVSRLSLPSLLDAAEALGIKGLCRTADDNDSSQNVQESIELDPLPKKKRFKPEAKPESAGEQVSVDLLTVSPSFGGLDESALSSLKSEPVDVNVNGLGEKAVSHEGLLLPSDASEESMNADTGDVAVEVFENEGLEDTARPHRTSQEVSLWSTASENDGNGTIDLGMMEENLGKSIMKWCEARTQYLTCAFRENDNFFIETFITNGKIGGRFTCLKCNPISVIKVTGVDEVATCGRKMRWDKRNICRHIMTKHYRKR